MTSADLLMDFFIACAAGGIGYGGLRIIAEVGAKLILNSPEAKGLRQKIKRCATLLPRFSQRSTKLRTRTLEIEVRRRNLYRRLDGLTRQISNLDKREDQLIRVVGRRRQGYRLFKAIMTNRHVQSAQREARVHGLLDASWAGAQEIEIWAGSIQEAKALLSGRFPASLGFALIDLREAGSQPAAEMRGAAP